MLETLILISTLIIDQITKFWAAGPLAAMPNGTFTIWDGVFSLSYVENRGAAFGMMQNAMWFFIPATIISVLVLCYMLIKMRRKLNLSMRIGLSLILSGALGNFIDRVFIGYVRDMFYFELINFAVFNFADACICIGAALVIVMIFYDDYKISKQKKSSKGENND